MYYKKGQIVTGVAQKWIPSSRALEVQLDGTIGIVPQDEISIYEKGSEGFPKIVQYLLGKALPYQVIDSYKDHTFLSRVILAEKLLRSLREKESLENLRLFGVVTNIHKTCAFVDINGVSAIAPIVELTYARVPNADWVVSYGERYPWQLLKIGEDNKLLISLKQAFGTLPEVLNRIEIGALCSVRVLGRVRPELDINDSDSYYFILDKILTGIVDIPKTVNVAFGDTITVCILKRAERGLRASFITK